MGRGRPSGAVKEQNRIKRLRAFELYAGGQKKSEIARTLGLTKAAVGTWAKQDVWDDRLASLANRAEEAADLATAETISDIIVKIRSKYHQRLKELDQICTSVLSTPQTKISAIKAWFELGQKVQPDALRPASDPRNLELIQDLLPQESPTVGQPAPPTSGYLTGHPHHDPLGGAPQTPDGSRIDSDPASPTPSPSSRLGG